MTAAQRVPARDPELELVADMARFQHDPLGFVLYAFPWGVPKTELAKHSGPRKWQREILTEIGARLRRGAASASEVVREAVSSGHGIGKSALVAWLVLWSLSTFEDSRAVVTANTEKQLQTKTSPEIAKWHRLAINSHWFRYTTTALHSADPDHEKTWRADLIPWSEHNTEAFAGLHNEGKRLLVVFDEASKIADTVWDVTEGALTDSDTEIVWAAFGNPTRNTGRFRECFRKFRHRWACRSIDARTVEGTNKALFAQWVEDYGEDSDFVKVRVRGMFPAQSLKQFISEADVDKAYGRVLRPDQYEWAPKILGVDPAWSGDDEFVIVLRQGLSARVLRTIPKNDNDVQMASIIGQIEDEEHVDAVFIDGGFGTGIASVGHTLGRGWILVWFSEASSSPGDLNKRSEMWRNMRDFFKAGGAIPKDQRLRDEVLGPEIVARMDGKLQLESKEDMKKRGLPSPNRADALALTFAHPVASTRGPAARGRVVSEYDPYAEPGE